MKKYTLVFFMALSVFDNAALAQTYQVKTIFEWQKVADTKRPLNSPLSPLKYNEEELLQKVEMAEDGPADKKGSDEIDAGIGALAEWLQKNPAGRNAAPTQTIMYGGSYQNEQGYMLQYSGAGFNFVSSTGENRPLGSVFYVEAEAHGYQANVYDTGINSRYYDPTGKLIFNRKFQYAEKTNDGYYRYYDGNKAGIADSAGNILLKAAYDHAEAFLFNKKLWFSVLQNGQAFFMEKGNAKPVLNNKSGNAHILPEIVANRYWLIDGRVYDMIKREEIFCDVKGDIHADHNRYAVFYVEERLSNKEKWGGLSVNADKQQRYYFDAEGRLLFGTPVRNPKQLSDSTAIAMVYYKDTLIKEYTYIIHRYGLIHFNGGWLKKPVYQFMRYVESKSDDELVFLSDITRTKKPGLMDPAGNILIPEGRFLNIDQAGQPGKYVCLDSSTSLLFDKKTAAFSTLGKQYFVISDYRGLHYAGVFSGTTIENKSYLLDSNYHLLDTIAWSDISSGPGQDAILQFCPVDKRGDCYYDDHIFTEANLKQFSFEFGGKRYDRFSDVDPIAPGCYFFKRKDGKNILQVKPGKYFFTDCDYIRYDPFYNWYIGSKKTGGYVLLDENGKELMPTPVKRIGNYSALYGTAEINFGNGIIQQLDKNGNIIFNGRYDKVLPVTDSFFIVETNKLKGIVSLSGKEVIPVKYPYVDIDKGLIWYGNDEAGAASMPVTVIRNVK